MYNSNDYLMWQFIAVVLLLIAIILGFVNTKKQKEINICYKERLTLINKCNKLMAELLQLRKQLRDKNDLIYELQEKISKL